MIRFIKLLIISLCIILTSYDEPNDKPKLSPSKDMMIRIAEIEVDSSSLSSYLTILKEEAATSVRLEEGVVSIYPMSDIRNPNKIRILEIYRSKEAYKQHLKTSHFLKYKSSTLDMVKSLELIDVEAIDQTSMPNIFRKMKLK